MMMRKPKLALDELARNAWTYQLYAQLRKQPAAPPTKTKPRARWRYRLRGYVTWCLNANPGWLRIGRWVFRWEKQ